MQRGGKPDAERSLLNESGGETPRSVRRSVGAATTAVEVDDRAFSPPNHFGDAEPHHQSPEESASLISRLLFGWVSHMLRTSVSGALPTGIVMPLSKGDKALTVSSSFFSFYHNERRRAHTWDSFVGSSSELMRRHDDPDSRGVLVWVGCLQQSEDPADIKVGIDWIKPPKSYRDGARSIQRRDGRR
jgi:hypothetical protein